MGNHLFFDEYECHRLLTDMTGVLLDMIPFDFATSLLNEMRVDEDESASIFLDS